ncbi:MULTISPECIES: nitrate/sulfonate/bicarbonate ABC transporter ATP-binding protein [Dictyoglomus]|jgi:NitT/TauT family transport system ATP-binding protein|uniref:ABC transporter, conserved site n=1 Tax=Dictyoglomus turgidum (strain DSM 6724 / Z-1310) TaxID=515635 RepID=B8DZW7_DICTD|nr:MULTISPECIES: nitrate/sulfonate/bicarbonate ABC transporter ATP-binding protein [Dictyoglomus]ACK42050.1 ABC transporter, conserved site [Dictyoglomus turgidum DSM 6724]HBU31389.1 nitrate ABC transporter ATP-binding protein [Dictyoglomus sp.]
MELLRLEHITVSFTFPEGEITVLDDINFTVNEGDFIALLGPSGSGKSTILRVIAGLLKPNKGKVYYKGEEIKGVNPGVAMVFQNFALFPWLTVLENVELGLKAKGVPPEERKEKAIKAIDLIGLDGFENAYPKELSGGMKQRVGFARALVMEPDILLLDEPFSALDVLTAENLRNDLIELWIEKRIPTKAIILVTHSIEEAVYMADRIILLSKDPGRIIKEVRIDLPHWRDKKSQEFLDIVDEIYGVLTGKPVERIIAREKRPLHIPQASVGSITGLVELVNDLDGKADIYKLGEELLMDVEDLLPIIEACEILGFAEVKEGDLILTEAGKKFSEADVLERKEIFKEFAIEKVPFLKQIVKVLQSKSNHKVPRSFFLDLLKQHLSPQEAERELDILIDWGRYAELFEYDDDRDELYLPETSELLVNVQKEEE